MAKKRIEFLEENLPGWIEGYITSVEMETETDYYFHDEWDRWSIVPKSKENIDYKIIQPRKRIKYEN